MVEQLSRRGLLGLLGSGTIASAAFATPAEAAPNPLLKGSEKEYPFYGVHQEGIITAAQDKLHFASFDLLEISREELVELLKDWTYASARMMQGKTVTETDAAGGDYNAPPEDTGEALDLPASGLTITFGFGPALFTKNGKDRFGIASKKPSELVDLPHFSGDMLDEKSTGGDICVQACADDPQVAVHAIRNLSRIAFGKAALKWSQLGFGRTSSTSKAQKTPRNLFGFKDGTANIKSENEKEVKDYVWVENSPQTWMNNGSYLVARKIRMTIETWDRTLLKEQERVIGRNKGEGAPLSGGEEFTELDFAMQGRGHKPLIDKDSHVALAHPSANKGQKILRRGYNYVDGNDDLGYLNAGLFFISFQKDPQQFIQIQERLAGNDAMNEYIRHVGSGIFACPGGVKEGEYIGQGLFS